MFDVPEPVQARGLDAYRATWQVFFDENPVGPMRFVITELQVVADERVAFAHALLTVGGSAACRLTLGLQKSGSRWLVTHEHHSMPVRSGQSDAHEADVRPPRAVATRQAQYPRTS